jgi:predicted RNase H-like HicB family nuclease
MKFPIAIEPGGESTAFGVVVPDLPGCFSAGDTLEEAYTNVAEAIEAWVETTLDAGGTLPAPGSLQALRRDPELAGWILDLVEVGLSGLYPQESQRLRRR